MKHLSLIAVFALTMLAAPVALTGCGGQKGPTVTPTQTPQQRLLSEMQTAVDLIKVASETTPPLVSAANYERVKMVHDVIVASVGQAGWQVQATTAVNSLKTVIPPAEYVKVAPWADLAKAFIDSFPA